MGLTARKPEGSDLELIPEDTYQATCYAVVDLGTQNIAFAEYDAKELERVIIAWEIPAVRIEIEKDGKKLDLPRAISKEYTISLHKKSNLRPMLESWRGKAFTKEEEEGFHLKALLGVNCMLQILHGTSKRTGEPYHYVANVSKLYHGLTKNKPENKYQYFNFDEHTEIPGNIPEWMEKKIQDSYEYRVMVGDIEAELAPVDTNIDMPEPDDDIPF
jgi:hypothetical protein